VSQHRIVFTITTREATGETPLVTVDTGGLSGVDAIFHVGNCLEVLRQSVIRGQILALLGINADGSRRVVAADARDMNRLPGAPGR
jgi:hypothetical protein